MGGRRGTVRWGFGTILLYSTDKLQDGLMRYILLISSLRTRCFALVDLRVLKCHPHLLENPRSSTSWTTALNQTPMIQMCSKSVAR